MSKAWRRFLKRHHPEGIPWPAAILYNAVSSSQIFQEHYALVAEDIAACHPGEAIVDIGTGPGWLLLALHQVLPHAKVVGVDILAGMVAKARENAQRVADADSVEVREGGADRLPFATGSVDTVVSTGSIHHWTKPVAGLDEICCVLKPGRTGAHFRSGAQDAAGDCRGDPAPLRGRSADPALAALLRGTVLQCG